MDDSLFARLGYDPVRIHTYLHGRPPPPGGVVRLGPHERAADDSPPGPAEGADRPREPGDCAPAAGPPSGHEPEPAARAAGHAADRPAAEPGAPRGEPRDPAGEERQALVSAWLREHWRAVEAMARAGVAPLQPAPPPPVEPPPVEPPPAEPPPVEPPPRPHVGPGDRWNKWKMAEFLRQLAATHSVTAAARAVGMSRVSAYKLRTRLKGQPFDIAWEAAFRHGYDDLAHAALELALEGEEVPHYYQGELVGTHRKRNPQLMVALLRMRNGAGAPMLGRYAAAAEFWSERWQQLTHRVETGSVSWDDEKRALGEAELAKLELPDEQREADRIIARNCPDEPRGRSAQ